MTRRNDKSIYIHLSAQQVRKLEVMRESIEEPVSRKDIVDGLIEGGCVVALKTLYDAERISKKDYESSLEQVSGYFLMEF